MAIPKLPLCVLAVILSLFLTEKAWGEPIRITVPCELRTVAVASLATKYDEVQTARGIDARGVIELWSSAESFTVMLSLPNGWSCLIAAGEGWEQLPPPKKGDPS